MQYFKRDVLQSIWFKMVVTLISAFQARHVTIFGLKWFLHQFQYVKQDMCCRAWFTIVFPLNSDFKRNESHSVLFRIAFTLTSVF